MNFAAVNLALFIVDVTGHGRLLEPPSRVSLFHFGYGTPFDPFELQGFCGGRDRQIANGGRCGVCGDPWDAPIKQYEAGGKFANGIIVRQYTPGQSIQVQVEITANHRGYFEFRLCVNNNVKKAATHECMNQNVLQLSDGSGTRYYIDNKTGNKTVRLDLPANVVCTQCVFQWKYHVGNSWGTDPDGTSCLGCGPQEEFYACADIAISGNGNLPVTPSSTEGTGVSTTTTSLTSPTNHETLPVTFSSTEGSDVSTTTAFVTSPTTLFTTQEPTVTQECMALENPVYDEWCKFYCSVGYCPAYRCTCLIESVCKSVSRSIMMDTWCMNNCSKGHCPSHLCSCSGDMTNKDTSSCQSHGVYQSEVMDDWCRIQCKLGECPDSHCICEN